MANQDVALLPAAERLESSDRPNPARALDVLLDRAAELPANGTAIAVAAAVAGSVDRIMEKAVPYGAPIEAEIELSHAEPNGSTTKIALKVRSFGRASK